ncbi:hypothetical protein A1O3_08902 [Capronia epimyces CBS 606.96]|uniref:Zn(2)-C6 fungal-type domain-containing protein n=1 Tax=Capronia epimyces CBS 606.96 TaxID=1182542 RepID=W9XQ18_9EURO|nr:uncharacterized protein A1O3_08902 [Capronia epimyces CBS 606.96]EXJ79400.1 hypothetical protein A1O3_08902 [Capronia epimyces CBS 606.96]
MSAAPRRRLACRPCTRRKVKCDKQIPCQNCIKRGSPADCEREPDRELDRNDAVDVNANPRTSSSISSLRPQLQSQLDHASTVRALRTRVAELETALQQKSLLSPGPEGNARDRATEQAEASTDAQLRSSSPSQCSDVEDAVTVLEFLAWGRLKDPDNFAMLSPEALRVSEHGDGIGTSPPEELDCALDSGMNLLSWLQILLPSRRQVYQLVEYHSNCMLWFHGSYFAPTFSKELTSFYADHRGQLDSKGVSLQWVALLFSVMAGTITSAPAHEAREWGFNEREARLLSQKWYKAVLVALNAANYTAHHSLHSVQAITVLTNTAHMLGHSNAQSVMLASAVRIAQGLGLHRLDDDAPGSDIELETGRRVWQELCTQDWFSTAFSESYSINLLHSTSLPPKNCDDDMNVLPESEPTVTSFCRFLAKIAAIMPALQDAMALSNTLYTKHEAVLVYDRKMRSLATGRPAFLANTTFDANWPCYIPWARRAIAMSSAHKIIMIHRRFLGLSFTKPVFAFTRRTCLAASKTILKEYLASRRDESSPMLWTHQAFSVAACIVLCFDILHSSSSGQDESLLVDQTLDHLRLSQQKSMIAARGVKVLSALQKQISNRADSRKRSIDAGTARDATPRKRRRGFDAAEFARSFCSAPTQNDGTTPLPNQGTPDNPSSTGELQLGQQRTEHSAQVVGTDETLSPPTDLNWLWSMPLSDDDGTHTFDSLLSFANQGLGL